ncbi:unnamed protein product [Didymodactylos carnosus]|uniref:Integrase zinc-binding domain-containing protein n=1 Tax=Didymodactylos carnosus TaxID=1234261 RepID=A0A8S2RKX9_9BILA|nr:unnamed protein product [Didymodactylos carnosus]CAF4168737.1 unnamed protein product [Didymodactylos carnosus]
MSSSSVTTLQANIDLEKPFYEELEKHINSLNSKYHEKFVITKQTCDDISKALLLERGKKSDLSFIFWARNNFVLVRTAGIETVSCAKSKKSVCVYEAFFTVISECHIAVSHGGRDKTFGEIQTHYSWVPRVAVDLFLKRCIACQIRKPVKQQHVVSKPIVSLGVMTRLQIDLIDMRTRPDVIRCNEVA